MGIVTSSIAAKFAFFPPSPPSYQIVVDETSQKYRFDSVAPLQNVEIFYLKTKRRQDIAAMFVRNKKANLTILYSHGNAADLGQMHNFFVELSGATKTNILGYDYTGYGASTGKPSEYNTYADIEAALDCLEGKFKIPREEIVLYGQSVGSGPTVELASKLPRLRGVVLHSPILSGIRVLYEVKRTYWFDIYKNIEKVKKIKCPVLVIHGTADEVVDVSHGKDLAKLCPKPFEPLFIEGGRHCDLEFFPDYLKKLRSYLVHLQENPIDYAFDDG